MCSPFVLAERDHLISSPFFLCERNAFLRVHRAHNRSECKIRQIALFEFALVHAIQASVHYLSCRAF